MIVGNNEFAYRVVEDWAKLPKNWSLLDVAGVTVDSKDRVFIFDRGSHPLMIFDRDGNLLKSWGEGMFTTPHAVRIGPDGMVYCVDSGDHTVRKVTPDGDVLLTLGRKNRPSVTGAVGNDFRTIKRASGPFNHPTDIAFGSSGELYVSDGYGNARIHKFSSEGELLHSWGEPGSRAGQFHLPHSVLVDRGRILVADRENSRIQIFTLDGEFLDEWRDVRRPNHLFGYDGAIYVAELGFLAGLFPGMSTPKGRDPVARVTLRSLEGNVVSGWGGENGCEPGSFFAPHAICVDSRGDIYVGEVVSTTHAPRGCHPLQKFVRIDR